MRRALLVLSLTVLVSIAAQFADAARPTQRREKADYVLLGTVSAVYVRETKGYWDYIVELKVEEVEKGAGVAPGDCFRAFCYRRKPGVDHFEFDTEGHKLIPKEGQRLKVFVLHYHGRNEGVYPDWADVLPASRQ
jgi:hypothetical protein